METNEIPAGLIAIAGGRDYIRTDEAARALSKSPGTLRKLHSQAGHIYGIVPQKVGNNLLFKVRDIASVLTHGHAGDSA